MRSYLLSAASLVLAGCISVATTVRHDDRVLRNEERPLSTAYASSSSSSGDEGAILAVHASEETTCNVTKLVDRTTVTTREIPAKQRWQHVATWVVGVAGLGALTAGLISLGQEPAFITHKKHLDSTYSEAEITATGHLIFWGSLGTALLAVAIADSVKAVDSRNHVGVVRESGWTTVCRRKNAGGVVVAVDGIGSRATDEQGVATFDLRPAESVFVDPEESISRTVSVAGQEAGTTDSALQPFAEAARARHVQELRRQQVERQAAQAELEQQRLEVERARLQGAERQRRLQEQADVMDERKKYERRQAEEEVKHQADEEERKKKKAEALRRLAEEMK